MNKEIPPEIGPVCRYCDKIVDSINIDGLCQECDSKLEKSSQEDINDIIEAETQQESEEQNWWQKIPTWLKIVVAGGIVILLTVIIGGHTL